MWDSGTNIRRNIDTILTYDPCFQPTVATWIIYLTLVRTEVASKMNKNLTGIPAFFGLFWRCCLKNKETLSSKF